MKDSKRVKHQKINVRELSITPPAAPLCGGGHEKRWTAKESTLPKPLNYRHVSSLHKC